MKKVWGMSGVVLLISLTSFSPKKEPCRCVFPMKVRNALAEHLILSRYRLRGNGLSERESKRFAEQADLRPGMSMEITNEWFTKHAPCGGKKFCVDELVFERDTATDAVGNTILTIVVMARP